MDIVEITVSFDAVANDKAVVNKQIRRALGFQKILDHLSARLESVDILGSGFIRPGAAFRLADSDGPVCPREQQINLHPIIEIIYPPGALV